MEHKKDTIEFSSEQERWEPPFNPITNFSLLGYIIDIFCPDEDGECQVIKAD